MSEWQMTMGWGVIGSRADTMSLYFDRPVGSGGSGPQFSEQTKLGDAGSTSWKDTQVTAVNHFRNAMNNEDASEYLHNRNDNSCLMVERYKSDGNADTDGVTVVNMSNQQSLAGLSTKLDDGTYTDQVNGGTLTVSGGKITSGTATPGKVSVFYNMKTNVASVSATGSASFKTDTTTVTLRASNVTGAMGTESTSKTATGRSIIIEGKYDAGTTTLTVKATRADGTVLTAQKTLVNLGSGTWNNSYWYPADSLALSGNGLTGTPDDANDDGVCTMTINAGTSTQITTSVTPAKANQHAIWYRPAGEDKDIATIYADGTVYAHKAGTIKYVAYTPSRSVLLTITVK